MSYKTLHGKEYDYCSNSCNNDSINNDNSKHDNPLFCFDIGIIGVGVLGTAILETLQDFNITKSQTVKLTLRPYDKYKNIGCVYDLLSADFIFVCLPTEYDHDLREYDKREINNICRLLSNYNYNGVIVIKSTIEPTTTEKLYMSYPNLQFVHNPEFLTARTAKDDFKNQSHIVLGITSNTLDKSVSLIVKFYLNVFNAVFKHDLDTLNKTQILSPILNPILSICTSNESESMKLFCNSFYATKIQFFTEIKLLCDKMNINYNNVRDLMLKNNWINPMHTMIPGNDGNISFGGMCFPKDINALNAFMEKNNSPHEVINSVTLENKMMRPDASPLIKRK